MIWKIRNKLLTLQKQLKTTTMNNIETLTLIANRQNKTLNDLVYEYLTNDEFKAVADIVFADINSRRIPNGLEPIEINFSVISACSK